MNRILIFSNDTATSEGLRQVLSRSGFHTAVVSDAASLIEFCRQHTPDLMSVDLDAASPALWNAIQTVKGLGNLANLPLLGLSTEGTEETLNTAKQFGFGAVFPKHVDFTSLINAINHMIDPQSAAQTGVAVTSGDSLQALLGLTDEIRSLADELRDRVGEFGNDGAELFGYIDDSSEAIRTKLSRIDASALQDREIRHDFRNMIGSVTGFAELIQMEPDVSADSHRTLGRIRECSRSFVSLLDEQKAAAATGE